MNLLASPHDYSSEEDLFSALAGLSLVPDGNVALIAGHFMLMYDAGENRLVPMIHQDTSNQTVKAFSWKMAGNFPVRSFGLGLRLVRHFTKEGKTARIALVVNDHILQTKSWQEKQALHDKESIPKLKRIFYRRQDWLPRSYRQLMDQGESPEDVLLENHNPSRNDEQILPPETFYFSETSLRRRFDDTTRKALSHLDNFREVGTSEGKSKLEFLPRPKSTHSLCLTESGGSCGCSGEVLELFRRLVTKGSSTIIALIPEECFDPVNIGAQAFLAMPREFRGQCRQIVTVSGLGGIAGVHGPKKLEAQIFSTESPHHASTI